jgi:hypothetical protein
MTTVHRADGDFDWSNLGSGRYPPAESRTSPNIWSQGREPYANALLSHCNTFVCMPLTAPPWRLHTATRGGDLYCIPSCTLTAVQPCPTQPQMESLPLLFLFKQASSPLRVIPYHSRVMLKSLLSGHTNHATHLGSS